MSPDLLQEPQPEAAAPRARSGSEGANSPERRCIVLRRSGPRETLLRFVVGEDGILVHDALNRLPGRGIWVTAEREIVQRALRKRLFERAAGRPLEVPADLEAQLERQLAGRCLDLLGLARRAGEVVTGFDQVAGALRAGRPGVLLTAADAAADGRRRLEALAGERPRLRAFAREELGAALGRGEVVHCFVSAGKLAGKLVAETNRLAGFRPTVEVGRGSGEALPVAGEDAEQGITKAT